MRIRWTKLNDRRHVLEIERDGRDERVELETRSTLHHDFTHFALEEAAALEHGFFGALERGSSLAELAGEDMAAHDDQRMEVERAVAVLQHLAKADEDPAVLHRRILAGLAVQGAAPPSWFTVELVTRVRERLRQLVGRWRATAYGASMELTWNAGRPAADA